MTDQFATYKANAANLLRDPDSAEYLTDQYQLLSTTRHSPSQLALAKRAIALAPNEFIAVFNYASALCRAGLDGVNAYRRALELAPDDMVSTTYHHLGLAHHDRGEYDLALSRYRLSLETGDDPNIRQSIALARLANGELRQGLYEFEVQYHVKPRKPISDSGIAQWNGEDLTGKRVILAHEQGFGDTIQFVRFAGMLRERCRHLIFSGPDILAGLIAEQFDCFDDVINEAGPFDADYITSCMAAAALMGIEYEDVDPSPYMRADPIKLPDRGKLKIGLSWKGSPDHANDALRSAELLDFCPLFDLPGTAFYSLQVRPEPKEITTLGLDGFIADLGSTLSDWRSTASAIAAMDVIVTVDTGTGHLAGALGKPTLLLIGDAPDWRWMPKVSWYQNHRIFRGRWPMGEVRAELESMMNERRTQAPERPEPGQRGSLAAQQ